MRSPYTFLCVYHVYKQRNLSLTFSTKFTYLKSIAKFMAHDAIQQWINACGQEIKDTGHISKNCIDVMESIVCGLRCFSIDSHNTLSMKWCPT